MKTFLLSFTLFFLLIITTKAQDLLVPGRVPGKKQTAPAGSTQNREFQFVESSFGLNNPVWEAGHTELEFADINRDGFVDILTIGDHGSPYINTQEHGIMVYFGNGQGSWSVQMTGDFGYGGIAVGDVNNDGHWDLGYGMHHNYSNTDLGDQLLEVALGDGTGVNWIPWDDGLATNGETWGLFGTDFADVDNDGDLDIGSVSFGYGAGLHVYLNLGDGTWEQSFALPPTNSNNRFVFGDINNDGNVDFVTTYGTGIVWFGDGTGNFTHSDYNLPVYSSPVQGPDLADINNDGGQDLVYVTPNGGIRVWSYDNSTNQWVNLSGSLPASGTYQEAQFSDFNADGVMDLAAFGNGHLTVWKGTLAGDRSITWSQQFTLTTSSNGDCAAFRAGGDVDRNGHPDLALVENKGSGYNDLNTLQCFKEATLYSQPTLMPVFPHGYEKFKQGSVQFIDWISAVPSSSVATVRLEYSLQGISGPWTTISEGTENAGRYQWIVPHVTTSSGCFIRYTLVEGEDTLFALTPAAFTILGTAVSTDEKTVPGSDRVTVFPVPCRDVIHIDFFAIGTGPVIIDLYTVSGKKVYSLTCEERQDKHRHITMDVNDLPAGIYFYRFQDGARVKNGKVTKVL